MKRFLHTIRIPLIALFWIGVWAFAAWRVDLALLLPSPRAVLQCLGDLMQTKEFYFITLRSLWNVLYGIVTAVLLGTVLAILTSRIKLLREVLLPMMTVIKATPVASFIILALIWIGFEKVPSFITLLIVLPVVWTNLDEGLSKTDPLLLEMTKVYRLSLWRRLRLLLLPSIKPYFVSACRTSIGLAWKAGIAAEIIARPPKSIGTMIYNAKQYMETELVFAWTLTVILFSLLIELAVTALLRRLGSERKEKAVSEC